MPRYTTNYTNPDDVTHRTTILHQIRKTNDLISGFDTAPTVLNALANQTDYTKGAHDGKKIALSVMVLLANARSILPLKFFEKLKIQNLYQEAFKKRDFNENNKAVHGFAYLSKDPMIQFEAIIKIITFYNELLDALYSLPDFSDVILMNQKKDARRAELDETSEDALFEM